MDYIIGVDIGTTATKAVAFSPEGETIVSYSIEYPMITPLPSHCEQDPQKIFEAVLSTIQETVSKSKSNSLKAISFASAMHGIMAVDEEGKPLTNLIIWADTRSKKQAEKIKATGNKIYERTGTPIHPMSPLCKLVWMKEHQSEIFNKAAHFISIKEFVFYQLFGSYIIDHSTASATGLFDIYKSDWNKDALKIVGIDRKKLSDPVPVYHAEKKIKENFLNYLNIPSEIPFIVGASDGCLANLGSNALQSGHAAVTIGTSGAIRICGSSPVKDEQMRIFNYILAEKQYVAGGAINNGGILLSWFKKNFLADASEKKDMWKLIAERISSVPSGSGGLICLPYLLGERAPIWNADARGVFFGINIQHTQNHFLRAIMEGIIYGIYSIGKIVEEKSSAIEVIHASGAFIKCGAWLQILADVFNKKVVVSKCQENAALGAAIIAMKSLKMINDIEEQSKKIAVSAEFLPDTARHQTYMKHHAIYERLYVKLKDEFTAINELQK